MFRIYNTENNFDVDEEVNNEENENFIEISGLLESEHVDVESYNISLPPHQRCAAHSLNLIASVDIQEAEKDSLYKMISRKVFGKCQAIFNKQNQSTVAADTIKNYLGRYLITPNATR